MATMIRQTLRLDRVNFQLFNSDFFHIIGPDETVILPHAWEHMVRVGWHVRLELLNNYKLEHTCLEVPPDCQQVCGTADCGAKGDAARAVEEITKELHAVREARNLDSAEQEAAREARQKEREGQKELHRLFVEVQNIWDEELNEHKKAQRVREEEKSEQKDMQQARTAEREEQRVMQQAREHEREAQSHQQGARAREVDAAIAAEATDKQKIAPQARGCCPTTFQRHPTEPGYTGCRNSLKCALTHKRRARYLVWFAGGRPRHGYRCCQCCNC